MFFDVLGKMRRSAWNTIFSFPLAKRQMRKAIFQMSNGCSEIISNNWSALMNWDLVLVGLHKPIFPLKPKNQTQNLLSHTGKVKLDSVRIFLNWQWNPSVEQRTLKSVVQWFLSLLRADRLPKQNGLLIHCNCLLSMRILVNST